MDVICPARKPHPVTVALLGQFAPSAVIPFMEDNESYWRLMQERWTRPDPFVIVEHDIGINARVMQQFEDCREPWCVFPYRGPVPAGELTYSTIDRGFGCVRFSAGLIADTSGLLDDLPRHWMSLADVVADALESRSYRRHIHQPSVAHYHDYEGHACV